MVSEARKEQLMRDAAMETRSFWRDDFSQAIASVIDDIRVNVVERSWYGHPLYRQIHDGLEGHMRQFYSLERDDDRIERSAEYAQARLAEIEQER